MAKSIPAIGTPARHDGRKLAALAVGTLALAGLLLALTGEPLSWRGLPALDLDLDLDADELGMGLTASGILATGRWSGGAGRGCCCSPCR